MISWEYLKGSHGVSQGQMTSISENEMLEIGMPMLAGVCFFKMPHKFLCSATCSLNTLEKSKEAAW